jgi:hypothetical protein
VAYQPPRNLAAEPRPTCLKMITLVVEPTMQIGTVPTNLHTQAYSRRIRKTIVAEERALIISLGKRMNGATRKSVQNAEGRALLVIHAKGPARITSRPFRFSLIALTVMS